MASVRSTEPEGEKTTIDGEIMDLEVAAKRFVENFYRTFDADPADLVNLYQEESVLIFDGQRIRGKEGIVAKLTSLPFQQRQHHIATIRCQRFGGLIVSVDGNTLLDGKQDALPFTQTFYLTPTPQGSFHVAVDIFLMNFDWGQDGRLAFDDFATAANAYMCQSGLVGFETDLHMS